MEGRLREQSLLIWAMDLLFGRQAYICSEMYMKLYE
jgi:hypothetical protein